MVTAPPSLLNKGEWATANALLVEMLNHIDETITHHCSPQV